MPEIIDPELHRKVRTFLGRQSVEKYQRLERINPWYPWVLRHFYGVIRTPIRELCRLSNENHVIVNSRRIEGLYLLGWKGAIAKKPKSIADHFLQAFEIRTRLAYLLANGGLRRGDREILNYALSVGPNTLDISRGTDWSEAEARWAIKRFLGWADREVLQPGEHARRLAFEELLETGENPKAGIELRILEALSDGRGLTELAAEWDVPSVTVSALTTEIRTEISRHAGTKSAYRQLLRRGADEGLKGPQLVKWVNSNLLGLYRTFRRAANPFSFRERRYLRRRINGESIEAAALNVLGMKYPPGSVIDRAFIEPLRREEFVFPKTMSLPPFTRSQEEWMEAMRYARVS